MRRLVDEGFAPDVVEFCNRQRLVRLDHAALRVVHAHEAAACSLGEAGGEEEEGEEGVGREDHQHDARERAALLCCPRGRAAHKLRRVIRVGRHGISRCALPN